VSQTAEQHLRCVLLGNQLLSHRDAEMTIDLPDGATTFFSHWKPDGLGPKSFGNPPDCNLIDGESFVRQMLYGKRFFKANFGKDVKIGWNPDSFGYNWNMPQLLSKSGFTSFVTQKISWNETNVFPYFFFWWEGPDGSRLLTYFPPTGYVGDLSSDELTEGVRLFEHNTGLKNPFILYGLGDHGGGPNRRMLDRARDLADQKIFPKIKPSTAADYLGQFKPEVLKALPVWNDELYLEYHRGTFTTQAATKNNNKLRRPTHP
jgi:alpha-mannosidase